MAINYLAEILAFNEWKEVNPLPASAVALWHELMAVCNKTGWQRQFTVSNGMLQVKAGLSRKQFERARQLLIQKGRIKYKKSGRANQAGWYEIIPIVQNGQQEGQQQGQQKGQHKGHSWDSEGGTLYKHKLKLENNDVYDHNARLTNIFALLEKELGRPLSPPEVERIKQWVSQEQLTDELIIEAVRRAVRRGKTTFSYIASILGHWQKNNVRTLNDVAVLDRQFYAGRTLQKPEQPPLDEEQQKIFNLLLMS